MPPSNSRWFRDPRLTIFLAAVAVLVLILSAPASLREAYSRGGFYLFSRAFFEDLPKRLSGPGKLRFVLQPLIAIMLGVRGGITDAREQTPPYLFALFFHPDLRTELLHSGYASVANLVLMAIIIDAVCQWLILGMSYPSAAILVGPILIMLPYSIARALANRATRLVQNGTRSHTEVPKRRH